MENARKVSRRPFDLTPSTLRLLRRAGYLNVPLKRNASYTFQELVLLKTVGALRAAQLPVRKINRALRDLRTWIDAASPVSRINLEFVGEVVRARAGGVSWESDSGQYALALERIDFDSHVVPIVCHEKVMKKILDTAHGHYLRGTQLEEADVTAARAAYESCLAGDCRHLEARINLGRLLHLAGMLREAEKIYSAHEEPSAVLYFNLGVLLEDLKRELEAIDAYRKAIVHDPAMADAHFNLSLLHERLGEAQAAFRHLLTYRRLTAAHRSTSGRA